jgi:O-antigen/teichoic acid export membrane protein
MRSATIHRLRPAADTAARSDGKADAEAKANAAEIAAIEDTLEGSARGFTANILAQAADIFSSDGERQRTQRNAILAFAVRCTSAGLLYLSQIVLARWMGTNDYGIYVFVWTWVLILGGLSHLGMNLATIRLSPTYREAGDFDRLRGLTRGARLMALGCGTLIMLAGIAGLTLFKSHIEGQFVLPLYLALVCVPLYALTDVQDGIGRGNAWMGIALTPPYILRPVLVLASMFAAHAAGLPMEATTAAGAAIVATWGSAIIQTLFLNRRLASSVPTGPRQYEFGPWLKGSLPFLVILACELALQNTDILVISRYLTPADTGIYFAAGKTMALIMFVHYAVGSAVANKFAALNARGEKEQLRLFVKDAVNWTFWPSLAGAAIILIAGKPLLSLFGPQFADGYPVMCILVVGFLFRSSMGPAEFLLNMLGEQALCATVLASAAILNVALNFALVPHYGLIGAAIATSTALIMAALMNYIVVWRRLEIEIAIWKNLPKF